MEDRNTSESSPQPPRPVRMTLRFVEHRTARAAQRAWLGEAVAGARAPKLLPDATRLAPSARPPAGA